MADKEEAKKGPAWSKRYDAGIKLCIWPGKGSANFPTLEISRSYKKKESEEWREQKLKGVTLNALTALLAALQEAKEKMAEEAKKYEK